MQKFISFISCSIIFLALISLSSCQSNTSEKSNEAKADSLEARTKHAMDSATEATMKKMNSVSDSDIINDPASPDKKSE